VDLVGTSPNPSEFVLKNHGYRLMSKNFSRTEFTKAYQIRSAPVPQMKLSTRLKVTGYELVGLGAFLLLLVFLENGESSGNRIVVSFGWVFALVGVVVILVGLEIVSLVRRLQEV